MRGDKITFQSSSSYISEIDEKISKWLGTVNPVPLFLSMAGPKTLDTFFAWLVFIFKPNIFKRNELNAFVREAFVRGEIFPFISVELATYGAFAIAVLSLWLLAERKSSFRWRIFALIPGTFGVFATLLYPVTMSTNIVNGFLEISLHWPLSRFIYVVMGYPVTWLAMKYGWRLESNLILGSAFLVMVALSLYI